MKNKKKLIEHTMILSVIFLILHGCMYSEIEEKYDALIDEKTFLSSTDVKTLDEVRLRLDPYVRIENDKFELTILTGRDIGISEEIFLAFQHTIAETNNKISSGELCLINGELLISDLNVSLTKIKTRSPEDNDKGYKTENKSEWWGMISTTTYDQKGAYDFANDYGTKTTITGIIAGLIIGGVNSAAGSAFCTIYGVGSLTIGNAIYDAARRGPIKVETTLRNYALPPNNSSVSVFDKDGKLIAVF